MHLKPATRRFKEALSSMGLRIDDVAQAIDRTPNSISNVLNGSARGSRETKQRLTDFFGFRMFEGIEPRRTPLKVVLPAGTHIRVPDLEYATAIADIFSASNVRGDLVLSRPVSLLIPRRQRRSSSKAKPRQA